MRLFNLRKRRLLSSSGGAGSSVFTIDMRAGWNLIGFPSTAITKPPDITALYGYNPSINDYYVPVTTTPGEGYWGYVPSAKSVQVSITPPSSPTTVIAEGWNMISSPFNVQDTLENLTENPELISGLYGYNGSEYYTPSKLKPGEGYWAWGVSSGVLAWKTGPAPPPPPPPPPGEGEIGVAIENVTISNNKAELPANFMFRIKAALWVEGSTVPGVDFTFKCRETGAQVIERVEEQPGGYLVCKMLPEDFAPGVDETYHLDIISEGIQETLTLIGRYWPAAPPFPGWCEYPPEP